MNNRPGSWWLRSETDPRWNCDGRSDFVGGFVIPEECKKEIARLEQELGPAPADLTAEYMKD